MTRRDPPGAALLFAEDFDAPADPLPAASPPPEAESVPPPPPEPTWADVDAARRQGRLDGLQEAAARDAALTAAALDRIVAELGQERADLAAQADEAAVRVTKMLMKSLAAMLPDLCERHGPAEAAAVVRKVLPAMRCEPTVRVRAHPSTLPLIQREIDRLAEEYEGTVTLEPVDAMAPGDVQMRWRDGKAIRDTDKTCREIVDILLDPQEPPEDDGRPPWFRYKVAPAGDPPAPAEAAPPAAPPASPPAADAADAVDADAAARPATIPEREIQHVE